MKAKRCARVGVAAAALTLIAVGALPAHEATSIAEPGQLFGPAVGSALGALRLAHRDAIWPNEAELENALDPSVVPPAVRQEAAGWVRTILKNDLVPADLADRFIAMRRQLPTVPPDDVDYLITRYQIGDFQVQILEDGVGVGILVNPLNAEASSDVEAYIRTAADRFLNLPGGVAEKAALDLKSVALRDGGRLYFGTMDYQYEPLMENRAWWNYSFVWSDGKLFYYRAVEKTGLEVQGPPRAQPGIPPRFIR